MTKQDSTINIFPVHYSSAVDSLVDPLDLHKASKKKDIELSDGKLIMATATGMPTKTLDIDWIQSAAKAYNISPSIKDYVMVPVIIFYAGIPNKNGFGFNLANLAKFSVEHGMPRYKTWRGKPTFVNHKNKDPVKAGGLILDTMLKRVPAKKPTVEGAEGDYWKELAYLAFDRNKEREIVQGIASKELSAYSMGTIITGGYQCSVCKREPGRCTHLDMRKPRYGMKLVDTGKDLPELAYVIGYDPIGFEVSVVENPAYLMAENDAVQAFPSIPGMPSLPAMGIGI